VNKLLLILLLCGGCATPIPELREQADACEQETPDQCAALWQEWEKRLVFKEKRLRERNMTCPEGFVMIVDNWGKSCVTRAEFDRWRGGL
jgi:hypothetical protein